MKHRYTALAVMALLVVTAIGIGWSAEPSKKLKVGDTAPDFTAADLKGKQWKLSEMRGKKVVIVDFARFVCYQCRSVAKDLQKLNEKYASKDLQIIACTVSPMDDSYLRDLVKELGLAYPVIGEAGPSITNRYGVQLIPYMVIVDAEGKISYIHNDRYTSDFYPKTEAKVKSLLAELHKDKK